MTCKDCRPAWARVHQLEAALDARTKKVYFSGNEMYVKIGHGQNPEERTRSFNNPNTPLLTPVDLLDYGEVTLWWTDRSHPEAFYHGMFNEYRVPCVGRRRNGQVETGLAEWFLAEPVVAWLKEAGVFDG